MRIEDKKVLAALCELGVEVQTGASLTDITYLGIGGTTDLLRLTQSRIDSRGGEPAGSQPHPL